MAALAPNGLNFSHADQTGISPQLSRALSELSKSFGHSITVNSGYRSPSYNASIGSGKGSYHTKGLAADIDMSGWSDAKRQQAIEKLSALGVGGFITYSKSPNMLHIDLRENMHFMFDKTSRLMSKAPSWFKEIANKLGPKTPIQRQMAAEMEQPSEMTRAQALATGISPEDQALASAQIAYGASRALNAQPLSMSPPNPGALRGLNVPSALSRPSAPPSNFSVPARPSPIGSAPVGQVTRAPLGPALSRPTPPGNFAGGTTPAAAPSMRQAAGTPTAGYATRAQAAGTPTAGYNTKAQPAGTPTAGYNASMPSGISRPAAPSKAAIAGALSQAQGKIAADANAYADFESARAQGLSSLPAPAPTVNHPPNPTVGIPAPIAAPTPPPALQTPVPTVLAPPPQQLMGPPRENFAYAPPSAAAGDVYAGLADTAMDNTGQNRVSSIPGGTSVTNKYGATTGMVNGYQTAVGSLPGISAPDMGKFGQSVKGAVPTVAGAAAGGLLAGPLGALLGGLIAKEATKPGGLLNRQSFQTDYYGTINAAKAQGGGNFPSAPSGGYGNKSASFSNRSAEGMRSISPGAAAAIGAGKGGLY